VAQPAADAAAPPPPAPAASTDALERARLATAQRDGAGCVRALDDYDRTAGAARRSTDPMSSLAVMRAQCLMLAGRCEDGKTLARQAFGYTTMTQFGPEQIERSVDGLVGLYCEGTLSPRDRLLRVTQDLTIGAYMTAKDPAWCRERIDAVKQLAREVPPRDVDDQQVKNASALLLGAGPTCLARGGDCEGGYALYREQMILRAPAYTTMPPDQAEKSLRESFEGMNERCKKP
jgi:hypothetical protein